MAQLAASIPSPITPPAIMFPAAIASALEAITPEPGWKQGLVHGTMTLDWLFSNTMVAGVVTSLGPMAGDLRVPFAPDARWVMIDAACVVPRVRVAQAVTATPAAKAKATANLDRRLPPQQVIQVINDKK